MHDLALCDQAHEFDLATKGSDREAASNRLGQSDEVGCHSELASGTAVPGGDAGLNLVKDKYRSVTLGDIAHGLEITRSEEHTSELQSLRHLVCRLLLEKK